MASLPEIAIRRPVFTWMVMIAIIVFGWMSFRQLGISNLPDVDYPVITVTTTWEGATPELIETEIIDPLEEAIVSVEGIKEITSNIRHGIGAITIEFDISVEINTALQELQSKISQVRLPWDADPPIITKSNPEDEPFMWVTIKSSRPRKDLLQFLEHNVLNQFKKVPGIGQLKYAGFAKRAIKLSIDNQKLNQYQLTILDIKQALATGNIEISAGKIEDKTNEFDIRVIGQGETLEQVKNLIIDSRGGRPIYDKTIRVSDIAMVEDDLEDTRSIVRVSGVPGVALGITKQAGRNSVEIGKEVKKVVKQLSKSLPADISIQIEEDRTEYIEESVAEAEFTLVLSALATAIVCWLFLGSLIPTANIILSIPTSIIGSFAVIKWMGFTLNFYTILALTLAIGIVVDDAIMVLENIYRHRDMGKSKLKAALDGAQEITFATISSSVAVIAIFIPTAFVSGVLGEFIFQFGITISCAILLSLLESLTFTPMRCSQIMDKPKEGGFMSHTLEVFYNQFAIVYRKILRVCLRWRITVVIISTSCFFLSLFLVELLRKEFVPSLDISALGVFIEAPVGSSLEHMSEKLLEVERIVNLQPEVSQYVAIAGGDQINHGVIFVDLHPKNERSRTQEEVILLLREKLSVLKDLTTQVVDFSAGGPVSTGGAPVEFNIRGPNWTILKQKTDEMIKRLQESNLVVDINHSYESKMPQVRVLPLRETAAERGVSIESIGQTINAAIGGIRVGKYTDDGHKFDIRLRLASNERTSTDDILKLKVRNSYGELVSLQEVAVVERTTALQSILRKDREHAISVSANLAVGKSQGEAISKVEDIAKEIFYGDYQLYLSNSAKSFIDSMDSLLNALYLGIFVSYIILASQFNNLIYPFIVLLALPFSLTGALGALYLTNQSINFYSMVGILLLMGITKKNSILLVEFTTTLRKQHALSLSVNEAILMAAPIRLRPILMTTAATLAAALPPALALGPGAETRIPMAIAIFGGIVVSTLFTLVLVPCVYSLVARMEQIKIKDECSDLSDISKDLVELQNAKNRNL